MDELEKELGENLLVIRIDIQSDLGRVLAPAYDFEMTPTFIFFDAQGNELWREIGSIDPQHVRDSID